MRLTVCSGAPVNADNLPGFAWNAHRAPVQTVLSPMGLRAFGENSTAAMIGLLNRPALFDSGAPIGTRTAGTSPSPFELVLKQEAPRALAGGLPGVLGCVKSFIYRVIW